MGGFLATSHWVSSPWIWGAGLLSGWEECGPGQGVTVPPSPLGSAWELRKATRPEGSTLRRKGGFCIERDFVFSFFFLPLPPIVSSLMCHSPQQGRGWNGLGCKLPPPAFLSCGGAAQLGSGSGLGGRLRLGWCEKVVCCVFRAHSSTLALLAGTGHLLPPAPGGGSRDFGALERKEVSPSSSPPPLALPEPGPAIPEVEGLSLLRPWSKFCPCWRSSLSGKGHPVYPPFSLQNSRNLWGTGTFTHT